MCVHVLLVPYRSANKADSEDQVVAAQTSIRTSTCLSRQFADKSSSSRRMGVYLSVIALKRTDVLHHKQLVHTHS
ncbi:hypothetical protein RB195_025958 [Necator americanus]|uniref:Uncharacterized protein n=1 Tax=Necator americanus TaxID=51031 RepID=A0ABR1EUQ9_NECAM